MIPEDPAQPIMQYGDESDIKLQANFALEQILEMHKDPVQRPQVEAICRRLLQQIKFNLVRKLIQSQDRYQKQSFIDRFAALSDQGKLAYGK